MFNIEATLNITPLGYKNQIQKSLVITRGATATLTFDLNNKPYAFEDIDQITFVLKQGQTIYWYKMFTYLLPTQDTAVTPGKNYYKNVNRMGNTLQCEAELVINPSGNPVAQEFYEEVDGSSNWRTTKHVFDPHFNYTAMGDLEYVTLVLSGNDTLNFSARSNKPIEVEVGFDISVFAQVGVIDTLYLVAEVYTLHLNQLRGAAERYIMSGIRTLSPFGTIHTQRDSNIDRSGRIRATHRSRGINHSQCVQRSILEIIGQIIPILINHQTLSIVQ